MSRSSDSDKTVVYRYGDDGQRALKYCQQTNAEALYFNSFYSMHQVAHEPNHEQGLRVSKHIFVGNSRLVTALTHQAGIDTTEQSAKLYYYHADHLQSAQFITDVNGNQYEHIEYTPYGELWIEDVTNDEEKTPFRFTGKELDEETGLYYYGARYLDPKYSRWLSGDPALNDYIPVAPINDQAKKHNENLSGMGGVFNVVNLHVYHYGGNNPIRYTDPTGKFFIIDDLIGAMIQCTVDDKWSEFENRVKSNFTNSWSLLFNMVNTFKDVNNIRDFVQGIGELIGRFTWGILGTCVGFLAGYVGIQGFGGQVSNYKNLTMVQTEGLYGAFTIGFVSVGDKTSLGDKVSQAHEYGHYLISLLSGPFYIVHALASLVHASIYGPSDNGYFEFWTERDADILGGVHVEWKDGKIINRRMKK